MASSVAPTTTTSSSSPTNETEVSSSTSTFFQRKEAEAKAIIAQQDDVGKDDVDVHVDDDALSAGKNPSKISNNNNNNTNMALSSALSTLSSENDDNNSDFDLNFYNTPSKKQQHQHQQQVNNIDNDNDNNAAVLLLAERLAPELEKAEDVFTVPKEFQRSGSSSDMRNNRMNTEDDDDDDDFGREVLELEMAEELLRQELEQATAFSNLFAYSPQRNNHVEYDHDHEPTPPSLQQQQPCVSEADMDEEDQKSPEKYSGLFLSSMRRLTLQSPSSTTSTLSSKQKSASLSPMIRTPQQQQQTNNAAAISTITTTTTPAAAAGISTPASSGHCSATDITCLLHVGQKPVPYHIADHRQALQLQLDLPQWTSSSTLALNQNYNNYNSAAGAAGGGAAASWYTVDLTQHVVTTTIGSSSSSSTLSSSCSCWGIKEYCFAMSESKLKHRYVGLPVDHVATTTTTSLSSSPSAAASTQPSAAAAPLPVRTIAIQIRPDVLCGAVMDAAHQGIGRSQQQQVEMSSSWSNAAAVENSATQYCSSSSMTQVLKRQGGHLRAIVTLAGIANSSHNNTAAGATTTTTNLSFLMDVQLCTYKSPECDRRLLIRVYHCTPVAATRSMNHPNNDNTEESAFDTSTTSTSSHNLYGDDHRGADAFMMTSTTMEASLLLREACALIQRMDAVASAPRSSSSQYYYHNKLRQPAQSPTLSDRDGMKETVSAHLLGQFKALPSVKEGNITLPALNSDDWVVIQASWPFVQAMWEELESRDLTCTTMMTSSATRFGAFPSLPTLDVHYCSQIRRYSRETMIVQLLKCASDLEEWAREAEYACANMISLLQPAFESYGIPSPPLPRPAPLTSYPLQFTPPQTACPPWGVKVMEALNEIQKWTGDAAAAAANSQEPVISLPSSIKRSNTDGTTSSASSSPFLPSLLMTQSMDEEGAHKSLAMARRAVNLVWMAFQQQDDEEKGARLERKNVQVMDRLAKMQAHQRTSIHTIERAGFRNNNNDDDTANATSNEGHQHIQSPSASLVSGEISEKAQKAADEFLAKSGGKAREVPLLKWSVVVGSSTGTCWVTQNYILFVTQLIPVIGGSTSRLFLLRDAEFVVQEEAPVSLLNPLPTVISLHYHPDGETDSGKQEVYTFRPSVGGARLKSFLDSVKAVATETPLA